MDISRYKIVKIRNQLSPFNEVRGVVLQKGSVRTTPRQMHCTLAVLEENADDVTQISRQ